MLHGEDHEHVANLLTRLWPCLLEFCILIDRREHATSLGTYYWLVNVVLSQARVAPASLRSGFMQNYSTSEDCQECEADFEARWVAERGKSTDREGDNDDIPW